jgi:hypothetical protein
MDSKKRFGSWYLYYNSNKRQYDGPFPNAEIAMDHGDKNSPNYSNITIK